MAVNRNMPGKEDCRVQNLDAQGLCNRTAKYVKEMLLSASKYTGALLVDHDLQRLESYLNDLEAYVTTVRPGPMDASRTHNQIDYLLYRFPSPDEVNASENETLKSINTRLMMLWTECANCQSCDIANGFISFDADRFIVIINSCRDLLANLPNPVDLPESSQNIVAPGSR
jgi:hypothetical protein